MQLGELQGQLERFEKRGVSVIALSVDPVEDSVRMIRRLKLAFSVASDQDQKIMQAYGVQNPDTRELALHAVFIVDEARRVFYRKVASRRPRSKELLDAVDFHAGHYPMHDTEIVGDDFQRAFPRNNFQALIEISTNSELPKAIPAEGMSEVISLLRNGRGDDSVIAFREFITEYQTSLSKEELFSSAAWLTKQALEIDAEVLATGRELSSVLSQLSNARGQSARAGSDEINKLQRQLAGIRDHVRANAGSWNLSYVKTMLRSYRKLATAGIP